MNFRVALRLGRISNLPTVLTNVLAGLLLALSAASGTLPPSLLIVASLGGVFAYVGGMYLNDAFDRGFDAVKRPERPIPSGEVSASVVFMAGFALLAAAVSCFAFAGALGAGGSARAAVWSALLAGTIITYDVFHKSNPLAPGLMGACRGLLYLTVASAVAGTIPLEAYAGAAASTAYVVGLTAIARRENDRVFIRPWAMLLLAAPIAHVLATLIIRGSWGGLVGALLAGLFVAWVGRALSFLRRARPDVPAAVVRLIAGISLVDAMLIAHSGHLLLAPLGVVAALGTRRLQRFIPGT